MILACRGANWNYNPDGESGNLTYWNENNYEANLHCFFRIEVPDGKRVKIHFDAFDFAQGLDYRISLTSNDASQIDATFPPRGN